MREIERRQKADDSYLTDGVSLLELARDAQHHFQTQAALQQRRLLNFVLSNCTWRDGVLHAPYPLSRW